MVERAAKTGGLVSKTTRERRQRGVAGGTKHAEENRNGWPVLAVLTLNINEDKQVMVVVLLKF